MNKMRWATLWLVLMSALPAIAQEVPAEAGPFAVRVGLKTYYTGFLGHQPALGGKVFEVASPEELADLPDEYDVATTGCLPAIRNQGSCGSCWAFSKVASDEVSECLNNNRLSPLDFSEQDHVANDRTAYGCGGGFMGFDLEKDAGITLESACPYTARNSSCRSDPKAMRATSWVYIGDPANGPTDEQVAAAILKYGSVSVTTAAGGAGYDTNANGDFIGCNARGINHMTNYVAFKKRSDGEDLVQDAQFLGHVLGNRRLWLDEARV
jgi:hypothetical protein